MNTLTFLLSTVIELYTMVLLLRIWMQWARVILQPLLTVCSEGNAANYRATAPRYSGNGAN